MIWDSRLVYLSWTIIGVAGFLFGLAFDPTEGLTEFLRKWQTLVAGLLAVVAAFVTVFQMSVTDKRQAARHNEIVLLGMRRETISFLRAHIVLTPEAQRLADTIESAIRKVESAKEAGNFGDVIQPIKTLRTVSADLGEWIASKDMIEIRPFLTPDLAAGIRRIELDFKAIGPASSALFPSFDNLRRSKSVDIAGMQIDATVAQFYSTAVSLRRLASGLEEEAMAFAGATQRRIGVQ